MSNLSYYNYSKFSDDISNNNLYVVIGSYAQVASTVDANTITQDLIFGKKVKTTDYAALVYKTIWTSNTKYNESKYSTTNFYVINQNNDVFKCISNNKGVNSTAEPITKSNQVITTSDGYKWKYMFTVSGGNLTKFSYGNYIPIEANTSVQANAVSGTIDHVAVSNSGANYTYYNTGTIQGVVSNTVYRIDTNASTIDNVYANSGIYIQTGTGAGSLVVISSSYTNSTGNFIQLSTNTTLSTNSTYIISPSVSVSDRNGSGFTAYSTVDVIGGIASIVVLSPGSGYINPTISMGSSTGSGAILDPYYGPTPGHGANPYKELGANSAMISVNFINAVDTTLPTNLVFFSSELVLKPNVAVTAQNTVSYGLSANVSTAFTMGDVVRGESSSATGVVYYANSSHVKINNIVGTFSNGELIVNSLSVNSAINIVKTTDVTARSGEVLSYNTYANGINRASNISEDIKFILKL